MAFSTYSQEEVRQEQWCLCNRPQERW